MDILENESKCYQYFTDNKIKNRESLRESLKTNPIEGVSKAFIETLFSNYKKEQKSFSSKPNGKISRSICISDLHIPYQDDKAVDLAFDCIVDLQPENLILNGDIIDCYWCSDFTKKPKNVVYLQDEANIFYKKFSYLRRHIPNTNIFYVLGNHEDRIAKNQWKNPQLYGLKALEPENLLKLNKLNIKCYKTKVILNNFIYFHGELVTRNGSYTAKAEFEAHKMNSGISGHTHRLGAYYKTYDNDTTYWFENGCLCTLNPDYLKDVVNWQHGFSIINSYEGLNQVDQVLINNYKFMYNNKVYK